MHQSDLEPAAGHDPPMVSVVITCFNYGEYLAEAINSAIGQSYRPLEVIVVNDGSTDDTEAVAMQYAGDIHYLYQSNSGVSVARNAGIRTARGDFVVGLDADDTLAPDFVEKCVNLLQAHPAAGFVYTQARFFGRESGQTRYPEYDPVRLKQYNFIHQSVLIRAPVVKAHMYDENFTGGFEDWNFFLTLAEHGVHGILLDEPLLNYRKHTDRISCQGASGLLHDFGEIRCNHQSCFRIGSSARWTTETAIEETTGLMRHTVRRASGDPRPVHPAYPSGVSCQNRSAPSRRAALHLRRERLSRRSWEP
jgi:glycosyltransferase involved in cell wall biosynthesis